MLLYNPQLSPPCLLVFPFSLFSALLLPKGSFAGVTLFHLFFFPPKERLDTANGFTRRMYPPTPPFYSKLSNPQTQSDRLSSPFPVMLPLAFFPAGVTGVNFLHKP